jgi:hypothetical protein
LDLDSSDRTAAKVEGLTSKHASVYNILVMRQKLFAIILSIGFMFFVAAPLPVSAVNHESVNLGAPVAPRDGAGNQVGINPGIRVNQLISNALTIIFILAALAVLFMLVLGAFSWITSGGDKDSVGKARSRIVNALIGLAVLALAYFIARFVGQLVGIDIFNLRSLPTLGRCGANGCESTNLQ